MEEMAAMVDRDEAMEIRCRAELWVNGNGMN
jgi:hypothetical protein